MILFDLQLELSLGVLCAASERERLAAGEETWSLPSFRRGLLVSALVYVPAAVWFVTTWPAWSSHYAFDAEGRPGLRAIFACADVTGLFACYVAGYALGAVAARRARLAALARVAALAWVALLAVLFVALHERSLTATTYPRFVADGPWPGYGARWGDPESMLGGPLGVALAVSSVCNAVPIAWAYRAGRRGRRSATPSRPSRS